MQFPLLPLAWLEGIGPLLVVAFWVIRQVLVAIQEQKAQDAAKQADPPEARELPPKQVVQQERGRQAADPWGEENPREEQRKGRGKPPQQQGDLRSEVDEFLKRISQAQDEVAGQQEARVEPPAEAIARRRQLDPFEEPPRRVARKPKPRRTAQPEPEIELLITDTDQPSERKKQELRHLPESQLAEQAAHLGERISSSDDRVEARLHEKFDHQLGKLRRRTEKASVEPEASGETGAQRIKALLARPGGVREAIILGEILRRPDGSV